MTEEQRYIDTVPEEHRKRFAQFFTPANIADLMVRWILRCETLHSVLEPAFGLGIFSRKLLASGKNVVIKGFDTDTVILSRAKCLFAGNQDINLLLQDYMYNDWDNSYDGIVCNPPYFKFHDYDNKGVIDEMERHLDCRLTGFTNLYTLFLLKSIHQLRPGGRCVYVIPSEFLNSDYGKLVKEHLLSTGTLRCIAVFDFGVNLFDGAMTTASLVFCAKDDHNSDVGFMNLVSSDDLCSVSEFIDSYPDMSRLPYVYPSAELDPYKKWRCYYSPRFSGFHDLVPFSRYARVMRGIATGANDYFVFNRDKAVKFGIPERNMQPCVCRSADVKGHVFTRDDFDALVAGGKNVYLFDGRNAEVPGVIDYIKRGEDNGIDRKHLTSHRKPWYALENRPPAPIWVTVFNRAGLRFVRNYAGVSNLTTFHCVYVRQGAVSEDLLFAYLLTATAREIFVGNAREYGGGLQKFEPNDLNHAMMLDLSLMPEDITREIERLYNQFASTRDESIIARIDAVFRDFFAESATK